MYILTAYFRFICEMCYKLTRFPFTKQFFSICRITFTHLLRKKGQSVTSRLYHGSKLTYKFRKRTHSTYNSLGVAIHSIFKTPQAEQSVPLFFQFFVRKIRGRVHMFTHGSCVVSHFSQVKVSANVIIQHVTFAQSCTRRSKLA